MNERLSLSEVSHGPSYLGSGQHLAVLGFFGVLTVFWTWPISLHLRTMMPGDHDTWLFVWNFWWVKKALFELQVSPFWTDQVFYPLGVSLYLHALTPLNSLIGAVVTALDNPITAFNLLFLAAFVLSGYAGFLLGHRLTGSPIAALIAGYVYTFCPYHFAHLNQLEHLSIQWPAFLLLGLMHLIERPGPRSAILAGAGFLATFYVNVYLGLFSTVMAGLIFLIRVIEERGKMPSIELRSWIVFAVICLMGAGPTAWFMATAASSPGSFKVSFAAKTAQSLDLLAFITPAWRNPILSSWLPLAPLYERFTAGESTGYLGFGVILLCLIGILKARNSRKRLLIVGAAFFLLLSLGPLLHIAGDSLFFGSIFVPLPQALLQALPAIGSARVPARYLSIAMIFIAGLTALGSSVLLAGSRRSRILLAALCVVTVIEYWNERLVPIEPRRPAWCAALAAAPGEGVALDLPLRISTNPAEWWRAFDPATDQGWLQTQHGRRAMTGPISHTALNRRHYEFFLESPFLAPLVAAHEVAVGDTGAARADLDRAGIEYFVMHRDVYGRMPARDWERDCTYLTGLGCQPYYSDSDVLILRFAGGNRTQ